MTQQIGIQIFNWGPCVVRMKISDDFKNLLLSEAKNNKLDYTNRLAGILDKETGYGEESKKKILPNLSECLGVYDQAFEKYINKPYDKKPHYILSALWINYQKQMIIIHHTIMMVNYLLLHTYRYLKNLKKKTKNTR